MTRGRPRPPAFAVCVTLTSACLCIAAAASDRMPASRVALLLLLAGAPYLGLISAPLPESLRKPWWPPLCALVPGLLLMAGDSALSDDLYRFAWDARVWLSGRNAYDHAPAAPALAPLRDAAVWARINHPTIPTIYPPLAQALFVLGHGSGGLFGLKLLGLAAHLMVATLVPAVAVRLGRSPEAAARAGFLWAMNPLAISESAMAAHFDAWLGLVLLFVALAFGLRRVGLAGALLAASVGLKLVGLFALPLLVRRHARVALLAAAASVALAAPLLLSGRADGSVSGIGHFGQRWQGNAGLFVLLERVCEPVLVGFASDAGGVGQQRIGPDELAFASLSPLLGWVVDRGLDPSGALSSKRQDPRPPHVLARAHAVGLFARGLVLFLLLSLAWALGTPDPRGLRAVVLALLLCSPQVHPWYLLWLLPLDLALGSHVVLVFSLAMLASYAPLDAWHSARVWRESYAWTYFEQALVLACLAWDSRVILRTSLTRLGQRFTLESARNPR